MVVYKNMSRLQSINEILKKQCIDKLKSDLQEKYYYTNRVVKIYKSHNNIFFKLKTPAVNINYIRDFISTIDKIYINNIFKQTINFVIQPCI